MDSDKVLLHLGCGSRHLEGFINSDKDDAFSTGEKKKYDVLMDIRDTWPYENESVDGIVSMVVLQCLNWIELYFSFQEAYRVLKPGGVMRMGVVLEETKQPLRRFLFGKNIQFFDFYILKSVLVDRIGFRSISWCAYQHSAMPELVKADCRNERGTSYLEVIK